MPIDTINLLHDAMAVQNAFLEPSNAHARHAGRHTVPDASTVHFRGHKFASSTNPVTFLLYASIPTLSGQNGVATRSAVHLHTYTKGELPKHLHQNAQPQHDLTRKDSTTCSAYG